MLKDLNCQQGEKIKYYPYNVFLEKMKQCKISTHANEFSTKLYKVEN